MKTLINLLSNLKKQGAVAIKQSLEDEGASFNDIKIMRLVTSSLKLNLNVKIGGCEAKNDIFFCKQINADGIVAPMVESVYALNKFVQTVTNNKNQKLYINLETKTAFKNIPQIIRSKNFKKLKGVVIGRSDLAGSFGLKKKDVDSSKIYNQVYNLLKKVKRNNKIVKMGGSITPNSKNFIYKLYKKKLLDRIETRNVEILLNAKNISNLDEIIKKIFDFELEWIKYKLKKLPKNKKFINIKNDYTSRVKEVSKRLKN
jgi:4-hydroxy-2-oxoheptanedioate aldolase